MGLKRVAGYPLTVLSIFLMSLTLAMLLYGCGEVVQNPVDEGPAGGQVSGSVVLSWQAPSTNVDGTPLTDLAGYNVHYGFESRVYEVVVAVDDPSTTTVSIGDLPTGRLLYFSVTAIDFFGNESRFSNEVNTVLQES